MGIVRLARKPRRIRKISGKRQRDGLASTRASPRSCQMSRAAQPISAELHHSIQSVGSRVQNACFSHRVILRDVGRFAHTWRLHGSQWCGPAGKRRGRLAGSRLNTLHSGPYRSGPSKIPAAEGQGWGVSGEDRVEHLRGRSCRDWRGLVRARRRLHRRQLHDR